MSTYTFTEEQIEAIAYVIKVTGCSFRMAYAACHETNYNRLAATKKVDDVYEERRMARKLKRIEKQKENERIERNFGSGFNDIRDFGFKD